MLFYKTKEKASTIANIVDDIYGATRLITRAIQQFETNRVSKDVTLRAIDEAIITLQAKQELMNDETFEMLLAFRKEL